MRDFALEVHFSKWEFTARYNLAGSDAETISTSDLLQMAAAEDREAFERLQLGYTETFGAPALRAAISDTYETIGEDRVLCLAGAQEGIYVASQVLLEPQDHAVVITPNYQSAETVPLSICDVSGVPLDEDNGWAFDPDRVRDVLQPNTRLVSVNFPNNPTGVLPARAAIDELISMCRERGIWIFSDEVYRLIERDPALRLPQLADLYEKAVSLNVMSKAYGLPGLRIGWLACQDRDMLVRFERFKHYLSICCSAPSEVLATIALKAGERIVRRNRDLVRRNAELVGNFLAGYPELFDFHEPDGGCVCFTRYNGADGVESFTRELVEESGVLLLPSSVYRSEIAEVPQNYFRIGLGRKLVPAALDAMGAWLQENRT